MVKKKPTKRSIRQAKMMDNRVFNRNGMSYEEMLVEARVVRLYPNQYGNYLASKLKEESNMLGLKNNLEMGDASICFDKSGTLEIKHTYLGTSNQTFSLKNLRFWQNFDFFVFNLIDRENDYVPEMYVIKKMDLLKLQSNFTVQNSDGTKNKSKRRVGQALVFSKNSDVHKKLRQLNLLSDTSYSTFMNFVADFKEQNPNCKALKGYSNYTIMSNGTVWNNDRKRASNCTVRNGGFQYVGMKNDNGKNHVLYLAKVIASAFIPNPNGYKYVKHINGDNMDNRIENLCWSETKTRSFKTKKGKVKSVGMSRKKYRITTDTGCNIFMNVPAFAN